MNIEAQSSDSFERSPEKIKANLLSDLGVIFHESHVLSGETFSPRLLHELDSNFPDPNTTRFSSSPLLPDEKISPVWRAVDSLIKFINPDGYIKLTEARLITPFVSYSSTESFFDSKNVAHLDITKYSVDGKVGVDDKVFEFKADQLAIYRIYAGQASSDGQGPDHTGVSYTFNSLTGEISRNLSGQDEIVRIPLVNAQKSDLENAANIVERVSFIVQNPQHYH